ncbi:LuxR family transcriptional regulator [Kribbella turkmenica]|uniref:LuxR family transcriptional regulator n=1 Tax=Kribbella turkmenica TaxID=2530375 RepID=A0A4R4XH07_9ACTN|nr:helix-turn-helix transcriptional regulator [Kribbella turkmenica]TDD29762.1 LuxR family transcriptional regulator [Kribbella turkmenica]
MASELQRRAVRHAMILVSGRGGGVPQVRITAAGRHAEQAALARIRRLSCAGLDVAAFVNQMNPIVTQRVSNGTATIDSPFWFTIDPESHLVTSIYGEGCDIDPGDYMRWELLTDDFIKTADVVHSPRGVLTLHEATGGHPERSPIYVEVMIPHGMAQELLVALRSANGENWGTTRLNRAPGDPMFSEHEISFMAAAAPLIAEGVRRGLLVGEATEPERLDAPGLVVLTVGGEVESMSPGAEEWFSFLPDDDGCQDGVPTSVLAAAAAALREAEGSGAGGVSAVRVPMTNGRWADVQGAVTGANKDSKVTVIIQQAHPNRIAPLLMSIYGLTVREQEVTQLILRGGSTTDLAHALSLSPHTVQQHLKSIFEKTAVNSRGELIAKIYFDCYDLRTHDNRDRIQAEQPIRGGPKVSA